MSFSLIRNDGKWFDGITSNSMKKRAKCFDTRAEAEHVRGGLPENWEVFEHAACCIDGCYRDAYACRLCQLHYRRRREDPASDMSKPPRPHRTKRDGRVTAITDAEAAKRTVTREALQADIQRARECYSAVAGSVDRLKWRKILMELETHFLENE